MNQSSNNGSGAGVEGLARACEHAATFAPFGIDSDKMNNAAKILRRFESAMALPGKWREEAAQLRKRAGRVQRSDSGFADALELTQAAQDAEAFADELEAIFGPAQPFLSGEGVGVSNASEPPATDAPERGLETPRRMAAVSLLLDQGYAWDGERWTPPAGGGDALEQGSPSWYADELLTLAKYLEGRNAGICNGAALTIRRLASGGGASTDARDAARYRWLRESAHTVAWNGYVEWNLTTGDDREAFDAAVDEAMGVTPEVAGGARVGQEAGPTFTTGHCENHKKPGGCPLHNLHCGWPNCDRRALTTGGPR